MIRDSIAELKSVGERMASSVASSTKTALDAIRDLAREATTDISKMGRLAASQIQEAGERALPPIQALATRAIGTVTGAVGSFLTSAEKALSDVRNKAEETVEAVEKAARRATDAVKKAVEGAAVSVGTAFREMVHSAGVSVESATAGVQKAAERMLNRTRSAADEAVGHVATTAQKVVDRTADATESVTEQVRKSTQKMVRDTAGAAEDATEKVGTAAKKMVVDTAAAGEDATEKVGKAAKQMATDAAAGADRAYGKIGKALERSSATAHGAGKRAAKALEQEAGAGARRVERAYAAAYERAAVGGAKAAKDAEAKLKAAGGGGGGGGGGDDDKKKGGGGILPWSKVQGMASSALQTLARGAISQAAKMEQAWARLQRTVAMTGGNWDKHRVGIEQMAAQFERTTTFGREEFVTGLEEMTRRTGSVTSAMNLMGVVANVAAHKKISLADAGKIVEEVYRGEGDAIGEFGIKAKTSSERIAELAAKSNGWAEGEAKTFGGQLTILNNLWKGFQAELGGALIAGENGSTVMEKLRGVVERLTAWVQQNKEAINAFGTVVIWLVENGIKYLFIGLDTIVSLLRVDFLQSLANGREALAWMAVAIADVVEAGAGLMDVFGNDAAAERWRRFARERREDAEEMRQAAAKDRAAADQVFQNYADRVHSTAGRESVVPSAAPSTPLDTSRAHTARFRPAAKKEDSGGGGASGAEEDPDEKKIQLWAEAKRLGVLENKERDDARAMEARLNAELLRGNLSIEDRIRLRQRLNQLAEITVDDTAAREAAERARLEEERIQRQEQEISLLERAASVNESREETLARILRIEQELTAEASDQTRTFDQRVAARERLNRATGVRQGIQQAQAEDERARKAAEDRKKQPPVADLNIARLGKVSQEAKKLLEGMESGARKTGDAMAGHMAGAFEKMMTGAWSVGDAFNALWEGMAQGALKGVAAKAQGRAGEEAAEAVSAIARGIGYAATPGMQGMAAGQFASAAKHMVAAAAWSALAGGANAAAAAVGGGAAGGSGTPQQSRDAGSGVAERAEKRGPEIHVYVDGMDPSNPRHQKLTQQTMQSVRERYGTDSKVTYGSRRAS